MARASKKRRSFRTSDVLDQAMIQEVALSPDASSIVYSRRTVEDGKYRKRLWRVGFEGGKPEPLTFSKATDGAPRFSPDGRTLLFLSDRSGRSQPWLMPFSGGEPRRPAELGGGVKAAEWSPDGKRIAVVAPSGKQRYIVGKPDDPTARRITDLTWRLDGVGMRDQFNSAWMIRETGGRPKRIVDPWFEVDGVFWSSSGDAVGLLADTSEDAAIMETNSAWSVSPKGGHLERIVSLEGSVYAAAWSGSGILAFVGIDRAGTPEWANPYLYALEGSSPRRLGAGLDLPVMNTTYGDLVDPESSVSFCWSDDDHIVAIVTEGGRALPHRFSLDGSVERLVDGDLVCSSVAAVGERVVVVASDRGLAGEIYAIEDGSPRRLTDNGSRWIEPLRRDPEYIPVTHPDGHDVDAWLVPAKGKRKDRPLVVHVHGGPHASHGPTPWLEMIALADAGIHVVYPNPRGSMSYGEDFSRALHGAWGDPDGSDIMAILDWAVTEGLTRPGRIGVMGMSYGGYMVNWLLGHWPGRFAAAVSENPVTDMVGEFGQSDVGIMTDETAVGAGTLPEDLDEFLVRSPYVTIHKSEAPLLMLQSEADLRCPAGQSELVFTILRARGLPVEMVRYPNEPHYLLGMGRPDRRIDRLERIVEWFQRHLSGADGKSKRAQRP